MDFWFAIYISFCQLLILLSSFTQFQRCLNVPGCLMRHFPTSFFGRLPGGGSILSRHHDSVNISFKLSLKHLHSNQYFAANWNRRIVYLYFFNTCTLYRCQISATTATPCTNRRRQRLVACDVYIPILHCIGQALTLCKFVGRESRAGAHQHKYNQAEKLKQKKEIKVICETELS